MTVDEFQQAFENEITELLARIEHRYSITDAEMIAVVYASAKKYLADALSQTGNPGLSDEARKAGAIKYIGHSFWDLGFGSRLAGLGFGIWILGFNCRIGASDSSQRTEAAVGVSA